MERRTLAQEGARVVRVTIDADLKRDVAKALAGGGTSPRAAQKQEVAEAARSASRRREDSDPRRAAGGRTRRRATRRTRSGTRHRTLPTRTSGRQDRLPVLRRRPRPTHRLEDARRMTIRRTSRRARTLRVYAAAGALPDARGPAQRLLPAPAVRGVHRAAARRRGGGIHPPRARTRPCRGDRGAGDGPASITWAPSRSTRRWTMSTTGTGGSTVRPAFAVA